MMEKTVHRVIKNNNYTTINNEFLTRQDLSWKAKGILTYMLSKPDDWKFYVENLVEQSTDGEKSFRAGWKELKELGYIQRKPVRDNGKITQWLTIVVESPDMPLADFVHVENLQVENVDVENLHVENAGLLNTDKTKDLYKLNTDKPKTESAYGEFNNVKLTPEELEKLKERYPSQYLNMIEELSQYIASSGKKYKSHYATILAWLRKRDSETHAGKKVIKKEIYKSNDQVAGNQTAIKKELEDILKDF